MEMSKSVCQSMGFTASWEESSCHHIDLSQSAPTTSLGYSLGFWAQKRIFLIARPLVIYNGVISKERTKKYFSVMLSSSSFFWADRNPEMENTASSWHFSVNYFRVSSVREEGDREKDGACYGNEHNLCGYFAKAWTTFLEQTLFSKMSSTWNTKAWIQVLTQSLTWPGCLFTLSES